MTLIKVTTDELQAVASAVDRALAVGAEFTGACSSLVASAASAGSRDAAEAIADFLHTWSYGVGCMTSDGQRTSRLLRLVAGAYEQAESSIGGAAG